ncbi:hypothetical protein, partial [Promineifilum sp.]|uniref:hypothetical protein n=1 Tax=Promineifilum sp. TaxID=2664178 RepID=UPI0035B211D0
WASGRARPIDGRPRHLYTSPMTTHDALPSPSTVLLLTGEGIGRGDVALQQRLLKTYLVDATLRKT